MRLILSPAALAAVLLLLFKPAASAALPAVPTPKVIAGARMPALSPNGQRLAFVYQGDIWQVPANGGRAEPLTLHLEMDGFPLYSPDDQWIAFGSKRQGNWDIFLVPAVGGAVKQLTFHAADEIPQGWSPDGSRLAFAAKLEGPNWGLYTVDVANLQLQRVAEDYAMLQFPNYSPDGNTIVYGRNGFHWTRPRYVGSAAAQIWRVDLLTGARTAVTADDHQHLWTRFMPDGTNLLTVTIGEPTPSVSFMGESIGKFIDSSLRTPNLWLVDPTGVGHQRTFFSGGSVRCPTVASQSGDVAFEYEKDLWLLRAADQKPTPIPIFAAADEKENTTRREKLTYGVSEAEPSPNGQTIAFGLRGDIWTIAVDKPKGVAARSAEFARRLTEWEGDDSDFVWSNDSRKLFFTSDRLSNTGLFELDLDTLQTRCLWHRSEDVAHPILSPDGQQLAFWVSGSEGGLYVLTVSDANAHRVVRSPGTQWYGLGGGEISWSPDSRWIAYTCRGENQAWNIWIVPGVGGKTVNVTSLNAIHSQPAWSPDGKYLFFQSNRDGDGLYALPLQQEAARLTDVDLKFQKPDRTVRIEIDFDAIAKRIRKIAPQNPQAGLTVASDGTVYFLADGDIWSVSYDGKETKRLTSDGGKHAFRLSNNSASAFFTRNGELWTIKLNERTAEKVSFAADWEQNLQAQRRAAFTQFWRSYHRGFYDANFHGRDWSAIRQRYEPLLPSVGTREEFATLLQMMVGELESSHSEVSPAAGGPTSPVTPHLGFAIDCDYPGPGLRVARVPTGAPAAYPQTQIRAGEYVLAINGQEVSLDENLFRWVNDKQEREFEFLVNDQPRREGARIIRYKVLTQEEWRELVYKERVDHTRTRVEEQSNGKIGYLHLPGMGQSNQAQFEREAFEYVVGKEAMIIDVRFNNGGYIADTLIDWLERKPRGFIQPRDGARQASPPRAWDKPLIVLVNEHSFSNGEIFAYAMRARGLAKLVGTATPGYVIWTDTLNLVDGTGARMPMSASYRLDGSPEENRGEQPDVSIPLSPEDWLTGRDQQLDAAITLLKYGMQNSPTAPGQPTVAIHPVTGKSAK